MLFFDIINVLNSHLKEKMTINRICFLIRNERNVQDGTTGVRVNHINVSRKLHKMWLQKRVEREKQYPGKTGTTLVYWVDEEITDGFDACNKNLN